MIITLCRGEEHYAHFESAKGEGHRHLCQKSTSEKKQKPFFHVQAEQISKNIINIYPHQAKSGTRNENLKIFFTKRDCLNYIKQKVVQVQHLSQLNGGKIKMEKKMSVCINSNKNLTLIELSVDELISTGSLAKKCSEVITPS